MKKLGIVLAVLSICVCVNAFAEEPKVSVYLDGMTDGVRIGAECMTEGVTLMLGSIGSNEIKTGKFSPATNKLITDRMQECASRKMIEALSKWNKSH